MQIENLATRWMDRGLFLAGAWRAPKLVAHLALVSPCTGDEIATVAMAGAADAAEAVGSAYDAFSLWRDVAPVERARIVFEIARRVHANRDELAYLDAVACGNPISTLLGDVDFSVELLNFFAGLVSEMKGASVPQGPKRLSFSIREPRGVIVRIAPFNHPLIFTIGRAAAPLVAGNTVIVKPPEQAPLSALRVAELCEDLLPAGVLTILPGGREVGEALVADPRIAKVSLTGSVPTGKAVMRSCANALTPALLELGGKNALIACPDVNVGEVAAAIVNGMNFGWSGQSCGSTSRAFVHEAVYDAVLAHLPEEAKRFRPGLSDDPATTMGPLINQRQFDKVQAYIASGLKDGARLICGGDAPTDPWLSHGFFINPTIFADVTSTMTIATDEIFGPVLSVIKWRDETEMLQQVNETSFGLTASIWTNDTTLAHKIAMRIDAGWIWINDVGRHAIGSSFGGYKHSGIGREESLDELLSYTQEKNIIVNLDR